MIEPRFIPPPMPVDPGLWQWMPGRRITAGQSLIGLAVVLVFAFTAGAAVLQGVELLQAMKKT